MSNVTTETLDPEVSPSDRFAQGVMFGPYEIVRLLGKGGMGAVYEATHTLVHKRVALKILRAEMALDLKARQRFVREGQAASRLDHPHVVGVSDAGVQDGIPYLVMEMLTGEDLGALLDREKQLTVERTVEIMVPVCVAVEAAHRAGIVHRDLKPDNIFLARNALGQTVPKVLDFGISKVTDPRADLSLTGSAALMGTPYYLSPEQAMGARRVDACSDQYTLGVILYECLVGRRPFVGDSLFLIVRRINEGSFPLPRSLRPELPERVEAMILRAMSLAPGDRFPSCEALARELLTFGDTRTRFTWEPNLGPPSDAAVSVPTPHTDDSPPAPRPDTLRESAREIEKPIAERRGRRSLPTIAGALALTVLGAAAWTLHGHGRSAPTTVTAPTERATATWAPSPPAVPAPVQDTPAFQVSGATVARPPMQSAPQSSATQHRGARPHARPPNPGGLDGCRRRANGAFDCSGS